MLLPAVLAQLLQSTACDFLQVDATFAPVLVENAEELPEKSFTAGIRVITPNGAVQVAALHVPIGGGGGHQSSRSVLSVGRGTTVLLPHYLGCPPHPGTAGDMVSCSLPFFFPNTSTVQSEPARLHKLHWTAVMHAMHIKWPTHLTTPPPSLVHQ